MYEIFLHVLFVRKNWFSIMIFCSYKENLIDYLKRIRFIDQNFILYELKNIQILLKTCCQYLEGQHIIWKEIKTRSDSIKRDSKGAVAREFEKRTWCDVLKRNQIGNAISNFGDVNNETKKKMIRKMVRFV